MRKTYRLINQTIGKKVLPHPYGPSSPSPLSPLPSLLSPHGVSIKLSIPSRKRKKNYSIIYIQVVAFSMVLLLTRKNNEESGQWDVAQNFVVASIRELL